MLTPILTGDFLASGSSVHPHRACSVLRGQLVTAIGAGAEWTSVDAIVPRRKSKKEAASAASVVFMVELGGIEPPSESLCRADLRA